LLRWLSTITSILCLCASVNSGTCIQEVSNDIRYVAACALKPQVTKSCSRCQICPGCPSLFTQLFPNISEVVRKQGQIWNMWSSHGPKFNTIVVHRVRWIRSRAQTYIEDFHALYLSHVLQADCNFLYSRAMWSSCPPKSGIEGIHALRRHVTRKRSTSGRCGRLRRSSPLSKTSRGRGHGRGLIAMVHRCLGGASCIAGNRLRADVAHHHHCEYMMSCEGLVCNVQFLNHRRRLP
jgi:hypothetical protein